MRVREISSTINTRAIVFAVITNRGFQAWFFSIENNVFSVTMILLNFDAIYKLIL